MKRKIVVEKEKFDGVLAQLLKTEPEWLGSGIIGVVAKASIIPEIVWRMRYVLPPSAQSA